MATIEQVLANPIEGPKVGRAWGVLQIPGGRIVGTDNGVLLQIDNADRGDGTFGPEVWPVKAGGF